jgi:tRNA A-37 threonylcarbamoyl transferase component Bud32
MKKLKDITPKAMQCVGIGCPAVFDSENKTYVIVGKALRGRDIPAEIEKRIGAGEIAIEIPRELLSNLKK